MGAAGYLDRRVRRMARVGWLLLVFLLASSSARAAIYRYVDREGVVHFTNTPPAAGARPYEYNPSADDAGFGGAAPALKFANTPRMWEPAPLNNRTSRYDDLLAAAARRYRLPFALVKAVTAAESGFRPEVVSRAGACGLMQLMPVTAREMGVKDVFNPEQNIQGGARYLRLLINSFGGDVKLAVAAYNAGPHVVKRVMRVPEIPETKRYVKTVLRLYRAYRQVELAQGG
jgi:soluble lytic murein transglycosylase-like protein